MKGYYGAPSSADTVSGDQPEPEGGTGACITVTARYGPGAPLSEVVVNVPTTDLSGLYDYLAVVRTVIHILGRAGRLAGLSADLSAGDAGDTGDPL